MNFFIVFIDLSRHCLIAIEAPFENAIALTNAIYKPQITLCDYFCWKFEMTKERLSTSYNISSHKVVKYLNHSFFTSHEYEFIVVWNVEI